MKIYKFLIIAICSFMSNLITAQPKENWAKVDEMHAQKWQYMVEKSKLTTNEVELVQPVFMEYEKAVWKQHAKNREFFKSVRNKDNNIKPNYAELNDRYAETELIQAQQFKIYHLKLRKLLSAETLYKYYKAEREFKRKLLENYPGRTGHGEQH